MDLTEAKLPASARPTRKILGRLLSLLASAAVIAWLLHFVAGSVHPASQPAGLGRGILHGALMPLALPNLLVGDDVPIYAASNSGRTYKLGYTLGVNGCGFLFFGFFFWRLRRLAGKA
jgi:hypothetical protein